MAGVAFRDGCARNLERVNKYKRGRGTALTFQPNRQFQTVPASAL